MSTLPRRTPPRGRNLSRPERGAVLIAGGGSGGHISPGLAIAERFAERAAAGESAPEAVFVCSDRAIDARMLARAGAEFTAVPARPASLRPGGALRFAGGFLRSRRICREIIRARAVGQVLALGGFVSAPAIAAARAARVRVTLLNLDRPPGRANRWMAGRCDRVWSAVELPGLSGFAERVTGMPIRRGALAPGDAAACRERLGLDPGRPTLLVTGASQGASSINSFMIAMLDAERGAFEGWQVIHLAGGGDEARLREEYARRGVPALVADFLDEMGPAWGAADLAVSRAGASSVAEVAANAVPAVFLPYPFHRDQHQRHNARPLVQAGGAVLAEDRVDPAATLRDAGPVLAGLMADEAGRAAMRRALVRLAPRDAAAAIAEALSAPVGA